MTQNFHERQTRVAVGIAAIFHYLVLLVVGLIDAINRLIPIIMSYAISFIENCIDCLASIDLYDPIQVKILITMFVAWYCLVMAIITYIVIRRSNMVPNSDIEAQTRYGVGLPRHLKVKTD
jgi:polyferredoxin